jgi:quercetin dioxygenase-like cupin family protein
MQAAFDRIRGAEVVLPGGDLDATVRFFTGELGFRVEAIFPADDPSVAVISGHGVTLRLDRALRGDPGRLRLFCRDARELAGPAGGKRAPNGTWLELVEASEPVVVPPLSAAPVVSRARDAGAWRVGRVGMLYRDLIPGRQGGRFIASHIRIADGGPVPDYVHYHRVAFQLIYCHAGWVRVVYEDQGPPFVMRAGDAVLQAPEIRHRVLESSAGLEVIEVSSPAEHETRADPSLALPTEAMRPERDFQGQRFALHRAEGSAWRPWRRAGWEARDFGFGSASGGRISAHVARRARALADDAQRHDRELAFTFVLRGAVSLRREQLAPERLEAGDAFVVPAGSAHALLDASQDLELLEVAAPAG